ncbi:hypothetical protein FB45DRAFT_1100227 [Roridomyces roridus]|uniref:Uncharacterized protein n=1 Tax=Roridomyces roridus TaxID=1738132 RepID=A0AAD7CF19_9AGAR|nr:hypothetical protein FB45DRAFT_1100227 [Roridomyces roridus]
MSLTRETDALPSFGRKNNDDSDRSSRESSPQHKVVITERSFTPTSDDEVVISIADNDDTPPPEGPLIRQAVAFSWTPSIATAPASINTYQAPSIPSQNRSAIFLPGQAVTAPPKPPKTRKKKRKAEDAQQTRFRIASYDPTPSTIPATSKGTGPYESMYRATSAKVDVEASPEMAAPAGRTKKTKLSNSQPKASTSKTKVAPSKAKSSTSKQAVAPLPPSNMQSVAAPAPRDVAASSHYRRDYDGTGEGTPQPRLHASKRTSHPVRLVTLLMEDRRGEQPDHQLVEVRVPLRPTDDPSDVQWAFAQDICHNLQESVSRIDGPAKVYAKRDHFRQLILKVTADNSDQFVSANVVVKADRTLDVVIETGLPPGAQQAPLVSPQRAPSLASSSRKRPRSPSASETHYDNPRRWSPATMQSSPPESPSRGRPSPLPVHAPEGEEEQMSSSSETSDEEEEDEDTIHKHISDEVDAVIQQESNWINYFKLSAKPRTAAVVVAEYRVVQGFVDKFVGESVPSGATIEASHIARALKIENEAVKYMAECSETVHLLGLYGPEGKRLQHAEVIEKAKDDTLPGYNANPAKALLRFMRQVDVQWNATHSSMSE